MQILSPDDKNEVPSLIRRAVHFHQAGQVIEAEKLYRDVLRLDPNNFDALHLLGVAHAQAGRLPEACALIEQALKTNSRSAEAHNHLGSVLLGQGRIADAASSLQEAVRLKPGLAEAHYNLGVALRAQGKPADAAASFREVIRIKPELATAHNDLGEALRDQGKLAEAASSFQEAIRIRPDFAQAHCNLGIVLRQQGDLTRSIASFREAIRTQPSYAEAYLSLGNALRQLGKFDEAASSYREAIRLNPNLAEAYNSLAVILQDSGNLPGAIADYENAVRLKPAFVDAIRNLGLALQAQGKIAEAVEKYKQVIRIAPADYTAHQALAAALSASGRTAEAVTAYRQALNWEMDGAAVAAYLHNAHQLAYWVDDAVLCRDLVALPIRPDNPPPPFYILALPVSADYQKQVAMASSATVARFAQAWRGGQMSGSGRTDKLRIGYFSADFKNHPTSHLIAEALELHDKSRFDIVAYSFGEDDESEVRRRIQSACTEFHDIRPLSHIGSAEKIRTDHMDILVDLMGHTRDGRNAVLAMRPAPVQINWLGYPGTMGAPWIDYIIADPFTIPPGSERFYTEKIIRLPDSYQPNDRSRPRAESLSRPAYGLPAEAFVFCCFNQTFKILPPTFTLWVEILDAVPGSMLWLIERHREATSNLRREAQVRGIAPDRLVFASGKPLAEHLARYRAADLALDTFPYTSHTTASDALWLGCPLVTRVGETFASRVAGGLLHAAGLPELITSTDEEFRKLAIRLAQNPRELQAIRAKLAHNREACPLFDTPRFVKNLEAAYLKVWDNYCRGRPPEHVVV